MDSNLLIDSVKEKIEKLVAQYEYAIAQNDDLTTRLLDCQDKLRLKNQKEQELTEKIKILQNKIDNLQLVEAMKSSDESDKNSEARKRVDKLISQIDDCIALLDI